jgi:hypothetical protein
MTDINNRDLDDFSSLDVSRPEKDLRLTVDTERYHNTLDFGYSLAAWIGFFSTMFVIVTILESKPIQAAFYFNAGVTGLLFVGGVAGYYFHRRRKMLREFITLPPVIIGLSFVLVAYVVQNIQFMIADQVVSVAAGLSGAFITVFIACLAARYRFILKVIKEAKINKNLVEKIEAK